ncbi:MAG: hypothetical protein D4R64_08340 [Porphyromonadaceae bacterium]|nr:MAG: hypothetical protein D4R64_08340 [Porphyromonadaceae bacterium]
MKIIKILIIILLIPSCINQDERRFSSFLVEYPNIQDYKYYLIVPFLGCKDCYSNAELFIVQHSKNLDKIGVFITGSGSDKMMKIRFGEVINRKNIIFISQPNTKRLSLDNIIYPTLLTFKGNKLSVSLADFDSLKYKIE